MHAHAHVHLSDTPPFSLALDFSKRTSILSHTFHGTTPPLSSESQSPLFLKGLPSLATLLSILVAYAC